MNQGTLGKVDPDFNPRSREGSDCLNTGRGRILCDFNPRSREGSDSNAFHADKSLIYFNPRSREGSDYTPIITIIIRIRFQSTLPRGERQQNSTNYSKKFSYL